jgi:hypothetical protein
MERTLLLVRAASFLVPSASRDDWHREWIAEMQAAALEMRRRGDSLASIRSHLWQFALGSLRDAAWHRMQALQREKLVRDFRARAETPGFCLSALSGVIALIALASGFLPSSRDVILPLPYEAADRIVTLSQGGVPVATRSPIRIDRIRLWRGQSRQIDGIAPYTWRRETFVTPGGSSVGATVARVGGDFFALLGAHDINGRRFERDGFRGCSRCVVISYDVWRTTFGRRALTATPEIQIGSERYRVAGVLEERFWFLSRGVSLWKVVPDEQWNRGERAGVVARLRPHASAGTAKADLEWVLQKEGIEERESLIDVSPLQGRVRSVFGSFALAFGLAMVIIISTMHSRLANGNWMRLISDAIGNVRTAAFFVAKTVLALVAVLLAGLEFTRASSITMLGGTDLWTEPISTWLFLMGSLGVLTWSFYDQRHRCRICVRQLGLAAHVGCSGSLLLNWAGTELVCIEGHGMLHVSEMAASWNIPERWTRLDESWMGLFARRS